MFSIQELPELTPPSVSLPSQTGIASLSDFIEEMQNKNFITIDFLLESPQKQCDFLCALAHNKNFKEFLSKDTDKAYQFLIKAIDGLPDLHKKLRENPLGVEFIRPMEQESFKNKIIDWVDCPMSDSLENKVVLPTRSVRKRNLQAGGAVPLSQKNFFSSASTS